MLLLNDVRSNTSVTSVMSYSPQPAVRTSRHIFRPLSRTVGMLKSALWNLKEAIKVLFVFYGLRFSKISCLCLFVPMLIITLKMEMLWPVGGKILHEKTKVLGEATVLVPLYSTQIPQQIVWDQTGATGVRSWRLIPLAVVLPLKHEVNHNNIKKSRYFLAANIFHIHYLGMSVQYV